MLLGRLSTHFVKTLQMGFCALSRQQAWSLDANDLFLYFLKLCSVKYI